MKELRRWLVIVPAVTLAVLLVWLYWTRGTMEQLAFLRNNNTQQGLVDQRPYQTAQTLAGLAVSAEEQAFAQQAERLADHEVDQDFAMELRLAGIELRSPSGEAAGVARRVEELKGMVKDDQARVDALTATNKANGVESAEGDDLDVAKAQLGLDQDELTDASGDLARETGDRRGEIQQELTARETAMKKGGGDKKDTAIAAAKHYATLWGRGVAWLEQRNRVRLLEQARTQALASAVALGKRHDELEKKVKAPLGQTAGAARVAMLKRMATRRVIMSILDDRVQTEQQLATVYGQWETQVWVQHRIVTHLALESLAWMTLIVLACVVIVLSGRMLLGRMHMDARRTRTLDTLLMLAVEVLGLVALLLMMFGVPEQMPTILGLTTAGLTVVFSDFILGFFGWFVLMGRNGIRVCDWVEINGVGGEVTEIGMLRTVMLETGNWTSRGHPTGRRVTFSNSFAIRGQFFNYSTHGQWMWDEIKLNVPATADVYALIQRLQTLVEVATKANTAEAEREWQSATKQNGLSQFSAEPTVNLRPAAGAGVDVLVRFVTRASERFEMRNRLYEEMVGMLEGTERPNLPDRDAEPPKP